MLNLHEAAEVAGASPATIRAAILDGKLAAVTIGRGTRRRHQRISRAAIEAWLGLSPTGHGEEPRGADSGFTGAVPRTPNS